MVGAGLADNWTDSDCVMQVCLLFLQLDKCAPRVCGDDPPVCSPAHQRDLVLPAYAGMIPA